MGIWVAVGGLIFTILLQTVFFAFFMGRQTETVASCKRRIDVLETKPIVNHEAKLAGIDAILSGIKENMEAAELRNDARFKSLEETFRATVQLATSGSRRIQRDG